MAYTIVDEFVKEQDRVSEKLWRRSITKSVWNRLVLKEEFPQGMGDSLRVVTFEANLPTDTDTWNTVATDGTGACVPTEYTVGKGSTERQFYLKEKALVSDPICVDSIYGAHRITQQIAAMWRNLEQAAAYVWKRKAVNAYIETSLHHYVAAVGLPHNETEWPSVAPTSVLTQRMLNIIQQQLLADSADQDGGSLGMANGIPQFILVCGADTSDRIMRETGSNNINAFLYNKDRVPELLQPLGVDRIIRGFYHTIDRLPPRFTFADGTFTEVSPYEVVAATNGTKLRIRQEYREAPYEASFVFLPSVFTFAVPRPMTTAGSGTKWNPQSYMGEFVWLNHGDRTDNPLNRIGFYYGLLRCAVKPGIPEFGHCIMHQRCPADLDATACDETGASALESSLDTSDSFFVV